MAAVEVLFTKSAEREFERLERDGQSRLAVAIDLLREGPSRARPGLDIRPIKGLKGMWRLRVGEYRGAYQRDEGRVTFTRFAHRSQVY